MWRRTGSAGLLLGIHAVEGAVLNRLGDVCGADGFRFSQIGNGAGNL